MGPKKLHGDWWWHPQSTLLPIVAYYLDPADNKKTIGTGYHFMSEGK